MLLQVVASRCSAAPVSAMPRGVHACLGSAWPTHPTLQFTWLIPTPQPAGTKEDPDAQYCNRGQYMFVLSPPRTVVAYRKVGLRLWDRGVVSWRCCSAVSHESDALPPALFAGVGASRLVLDLTAATAALLPFNR